MTTDALRKQVVDAMAQAMYQAATGLDDWDDEDEYEPENAAKTRDMAEAALDAALDILGEHFADAPEVDFDVLLAVLRAGKGSDE